jgi:hypothetical protein
MEGISRHHHLAPIMEVAVGISLEVSSIRAWRERENFPRRNECRAPVMGWSAGGMA